jgi:hypothetical protein
MYRVYGVFHIDKVSEYKKNVHPIIFHMFIELLLLLKATHRKIGDYNDSTKRLCSQADRESSTWY